MTQDATAVSSSRRVARRVILAVYGMVFGTLALGSSLTFYEPPEPKWPRPGRVEPRPRPGPSPMPLLVSLLLLNAVRQRPKAS